MRVLLRFSALLTVVLMVFVIAGCAKEEEEKDTTPPKIVSVSVTEGQSVAANASITVVFSEPMKEATITVTGATGATTLSADGKTATWTPSPAMPEGAHTVTISGSDKAGNALEGAVPINITVTPPDVTPPEIADTDCDPTNGADGVDPAGVTKIKIVFTEKMSEAKVTSFEPTDAKVDPKFDGDKTITISFLGGYKLGNEVTVKVTLSGKDAAGNELKTTEYTFTTMKKEG